MKVRVFVYAVEVDPIDVTGFGATDKTYIGGNIRARARICRTDPDHRDLLGEIVERIYEPNHEHPALWVSSTDPPTIYMYEEWDVEVVESTVRRVVSVTHR